MSRKITSLFLTLFAVTIFSCDPKIYPITGERTYSKMYNSINGMLSIGQLDSVVKADKLPKVSKWVDSSFRDYETKEAIVIKTLYVDNDTASLVYRAESVGNDSVFLVKRVMVKETNENQKK